MALAEEASRTTTRTDAAPVRRPNRWLKNLTGKVAMLPMILTALVIFLGGTIWTIVYSFTDSGLLPRLRWNGLAQYERLWSSRKWLVSIENLALYGVLSVILTLFIAFTLAALLDRKIRFEDAFRTIFLYPFALSFIVTGLVWQWILNPEFGIQGIVRGMGWETFNFDPLYNPNIVMYGLLIAGLWQGTGLIMCIMLAGLRLFLLAQRQGHGHRNRCIPIGNNAVCF